MGPLVPLKQGGLAQVEPELPLPGFASLLKDKRGNAWRVTFAYGICPLDLGTELASGCEYRGLFKKRVNSS